MGPNRSKIQAGLICLWALLAPGLGIAMSISEAGPPANLPPAKFKGTEFIDNRGCYYIQTGGQGSSNWVPRVTRKGEVICGLSPTFPPDETNQNPT